MSYGHWPANFWVRGFSRTLFWRPIEMRLQNGVRTKVHGLLWLQILKVRFLIFTGCIVYTSDVLSFADTFMIWVCKTGVRSSGGPLITSLSNYFIDLGTGWDIWQILKVKFLYFFCPPLVSNNAMCPVKTEYDSEPSKNLKIYRCTKVFTFLFYQIEP